MMNNVGVVLYKKGKEHGTIEAEYCHSKDGRGNGIGTGALTEGFEGNYRIKYFDPEGELQAERDLEIRKEGDRFSVTWLNNGVVTSRGIGFENAEGLVVGYYDV